MTSSPLIKLAARLGFLAGLIAALIAIAGWRVTTATPGGGLNVDVMAVPSGPFGVTPVGLVLRGRAVTPGGQVARGGLEVLNQTPTALPMRLVVELADEDLDDSIAIEISRGGRRLARSSLGALRRNPPEVRIEPGRRVRLQLALWVPRDAPSGYQGRSVSLTLQPSMDSRP